MKRHFCSLGCAMWNLPAINFMNLSTEEKILRLLDEVRVAVVDGRLRDAEELMIEAKTLINENNPSLLPSRRAPGW